MSVLIKGMEMPDYYKECPFSDHEGGCLIPGKWRERHHCPGDYCPLIALPNKHGKLIDADELKKEFPKDTDWEYPVNTNEYVCEMIDKAKPVIGAEDE